MFCTETETHKAKKAHRCEWCWQKIEVGATYMRYRYYGSGDVGTVKLHPECNDAMLECAREEGGYIEWTPGQDRPERPAANEDDKYDCPIHGLQDSSDCPRC